MKSLDHTVKRVVLSFVGMVFLVCISLCAVAEENGPVKNLKLTEKPGLFKSITNPPCSYCIVQHRKGLIEENDRVIAWLRSSHNEGAIPLRHMLAAPRVINDTYGIFFYDPDGGYVAAFERSRGFKYTYEFHGWRGGVMVVKGNDGSLVSALSGQIFAGPRKGQRLKRIPNILTDWQHWLMLHPESVAYRLFDGTRYTLAPLPTEQSQEAGESMGPVDARLRAFANVIGVTSGGSSKAFPLDGAGQRDVFADRVNDQPITVFWYGPTKTAVAFRSELDGQALTFTADKASPDTAPFKDQQTGTRWTLAGRAVDGKLRGKELKWVDSIQCNWYAWSSEYPETELFGTAK